MALMCLNRLPPQHLKLGWVKMLSHSLYRLTRTMKPTLFILCMATPCWAYAQTYIASPDTFTKLIPQLRAGDLLQLSVGNYTKPLIIDGLQGTEEQPIVIAGTGDGTVFIGDSCCQTVSLRRSAYVTVKDLRLDGTNAAGIDGIKAEGNTPANPNWTHHITLDNLSIVNYAHNQQQVGISSKCPSSHWLIKNTRIDNVGTGMYLGDSEGTQPFVNGLIQNNVIQNTLGYNLEIKHQINGQRELASAVQAQADQAGKTIIRHNVFSKGKNSSLGENARPNVMLGGFPTEGVGKNDYYEVIGNFFYNNPVEALFQGAGNINMLNNIFVNHARPEAFRTVYFAPRNGIAPQQLKIFHNTVWSNATGGGIRVYDPDVKYMQTVVANVVFADDANVAITANKASTHIEENVVDHYAKAANYVQSASRELKTLNLRPKAGQLQAKQPTAQTPFRSVTDADKDFSNTVYDWAYRGAYGQDTPP